MAFPYKHFLVVGATSGIGRALADQLVTSGVKVTAVGRRQDRLDEWTQKHNGKSVNSIVFDISQLDKIPQFAADVMKQYPDVDCVVLNAGVQHLYKLSEPKTDISLLHEEIKVNYLSQVDLTHAFLPYFLEAKSPTSFIYTTSNLSHVPAAWIAGYSASKAALNSYVMSLRKQLQNSNVKIIELSPPLVQSKFNSLSNCPCAVQPLLTRDEAELHDYLGAEKGRGLGMPLDVFTKQAYEGLASGKETVIVGSVGDEETFKQIVEKKHAAFENVAKMSL